MSTSPGKRISFAKVVVVLAVVFVIGLGLCGLDSTVLARFRSHYEEFGPNTFVGTIGAWALIVSALGLVVTTIAWTLTAVVNGLSSKDHASHKVDDDHGETKHDDDEAKHDDPR
jgi:hypothetical protein